MQGLFLDTNIFLRYLLNDDPVRSPRCRDVFRAVEEQRLLVWTSGLVVAEIVFVLSSPRLYAFDRTTIRQVLLPLLGLANLRLERKALYPRVFTLYVEHAIDYVDAYHAALLEHLGQSELLSFDAHFDRIPNLTRSEP